MPGKLTETRHTTFRFPCFRRAVCLRDTQRDSTERKWKIVRKVCWVCVPKMTRVTVFLRFYIILFLVKSELFRKLSVLPCSGRKYATDFLYLLYWAWLIYWETHIFADFDRTLIFVNVQKSAALFLNLATKSIPQLDTKFLVYIRFNIIFPPTSSSTTRFSPFSLPIKTLHTLHFLEEHYTCRITKYMSHRHV